MPDADPDVIRLWRPAGRAASLAEDSPEGTPRLFCRWPLLDPDLPPLVAIEGPGLVVAGASDWMRANSATLREVAQSSATGLTAGTDPALVRDDWEL